MPFVSTLQLVTVLLMFQTVSMQSMHCAIADWSHSMDVQGWSVCQSDCFKFIKGFYRNDQQQDYDPILLLEQADCCPATLPIYNSAPYTCLVETSWQYTLDRWVVEEASVIFLKKSARLKPRTAFEMMRVTSIPESQIEQVQRSCVFISNLSRVYLLRIEISNVS